jgi:hypothetical protein
MSTQLARSPRATAAVAGSSTRQQLDELDALLQRMLALPVQPSEDDPEVEERPEPPRREPARPAVAPRMEMRREPATEPPPPGRPQPEPAIPARAAGPRSYPASYMVVESNTPSYVTPSPAPAEEPAADDGIAPRMVRSEERPRSEQSDIDAAMQAGRNDHQEDEAVDPVRELARLEAELGAPPEEWVPFQSSWQPSEQTWKPLAESWQQARGSVASAPSSEPAPRMPPAPPAPPPEARPRLRDLPRATIPLAPPIPEPSVSPPPPAPAAKTNPVAAPAEPSVSLAAMPLVWFNAAFDVFLLPLGAPGQWLKGRGGRGLLGVVGLLCLAGAAALAVADGIGWTW